MPLAYRPKLEVLCWLRHFLRDARRLIGEGPNCSEDIAKWIATRVAHNFDARFFDMFVLNQEPHCPVHQNPKHEMD